MLSLAVTDRRTLRNFGLLVGGIFLVVGLVPLLRGEGGRVWACTLAGLLILPALVVPGVLRYPYAGWMWLGAVLAWINTRIILSVVFFVLLSPIGALMRLFGRDPMRRKLERSLPTYRVVKVARDQKHFERMF